MGFIHKNTINLTFFYLFSLILTCFTETGHLKYYCNIKNVLTHVEIRKKP